MGKSVKTESIYLYLDAKGERTAYKHLSFLFADTDLDTGRYATAKRHLNSKGIFYPDRDKTEQSSDKRKIISVPLRSLSRGRRDNPNLIGNKIAN